MKRSKYIVLLIVGMLALFSDAAMAQRYYRQGYRPRHSTNRSRDGFNSEQFSFGVNALYYFGDVEVSRMGSKLQLPLVSGFELSNLNASAFFAYHKPFDEYVGLRVAGTLGLLRGDNSNIPEYKGKERKFTSVFFQPSVGVQIYPVEQRGFYIYAGLGITASYFLKHEFYGVKPEERPTFGILPMGQASIGYAFNLTSLWRMDVHGTFEMGFCDMKTLNLDGWPVRDSKINIWSDGWFALGVSFYFRAEKALPFHR